MSEYDDLPLATVIIPTRNRRDHLRRALSSVISQNVPLEILVMDDGSEDGSADMVRAEFPRAHVHREETARGPAFERNKGAQLATTPYLVTLDDDCELSSEDSIQRTLADFDHPVIGAVTIPFVNILQDDRSVRCAAPDEKGMYATYDYYGGMVAFRREAFLSAGGYRTYLFMHVEEPDLAVRMLNAGYLIRLGRCPPLRHHESPIRDRPRIHQLGPRNHVLFCWYNVPMPYFAPHLLATSFLSLRHGVREGFPHLVLKGILQGYRGMVEEWRRREPVRPSTYRLSRQLRKRVAVPLHEAANALRHGSDTATVETP